MNVFLTGATGFVGKHLSERLDRADSCDVLCAVRNPGSGCAGREVVTGDLSAETDYKNALQGRQLVIHAAARAHIMNEETLDPLAAFRRVNVEGTLNLARQAAAAGVRRFIFISSIKVNGELSEEGRPFSPSDVPAPEDDYGVSKWEAEQGLRAIAGETGMEFVIIRPPLVYGPGVKGNFASMIKLVQKGVPLPLGAIQNKRSLVGVDNLVDLIVACMDHPAAANQTFMVSDGHDLSTPELLRRLGRAAGMPARLLPVPAGLLMFGATVLGKRAVAQRVLGSLQADISLTRALLGWEPPVSVEEGLGRCFTTENRF